MNKETAVEWLRKQIILNSKFRETKTGKISFTIGLSMLDKLQTEAKAMEKEQIKNAWLNSLTTGDYLCAQEYYNETFKSE